MCFDQLSFFKHCILCFDQLSFFKHCIVCFDQLSFFKHCILCFDQLSFFKHCILCFDQLSFFKHCILCFDQLSFFKHCILCFDQLSFFKHCILCFDQLSFFKHCILCFDQLYLFFLQARSNTQMGDAKWEKKWWYVFSFSFIFYRRKKACLCVISVTRLEATALNNFVFSTVVKRLLCHFSHRVGSNSLNSVFCLPHFLLSHWSWHCGQLRHLSFCWSLLCGTILHSWTDPLCSCYVIIN